MGDRHLKFYESRDNLVRRHSVQSSRTAKPRVLVIGATGHLGMRTIRALLADDGVEVWAGGRRRQTGRWVRIDLGDPATFTAMDSFTVIVNCADTLRATPDAAIGYCLRTGLRFVETTSDRDTIERVLHRWRQASHQSHRGPWGSWCWDGPLLRARAGAGSFNGWQALAPVLA